MFKKIRDSLIGALVEKNWMRKIGLSCFVVVGALAGLCISGLIGLVFGSLVGGLSGYLLERSMRRKPIINQ